jgi:hypothetical protein
MTGKEPLRAGAWHDFSSGRKRTAAAVSVAAALLCSGCAFRTQTARMAVDHNEFVAQTTNRQTVLNILRAREREPIHYTSFGPVSGTMRAAGTAGLNPAFNGDGGSLTSAGTSTTNAGPTGTPTGSVATTTMTELLTEGATNWTPSVSVGVNTGTDFQVVANATQEFYRGILGPVSSGLVVHFLRQGYPPDLLSHIVIAEVQFSAKLFGPDGEEEIHFPPIHNAPDEAVAAAAFADVIRCRRLTYQSRPVPERKIPVATLTDLAGIESAVLGRVRAEPSDAAPYQLLTPGRTDFDLALTPPDTEACHPLRLLLNDQVAAWLARRNLVPRAPQALSAVPVSTDPLISSQPATPAADGASRDLTLEGGPSFGVKAFFDPVLPPGWTSELHIDMTFRSVEGIIYYLGEYVRDEATSPMLRDPVACRDRPPHYECIPILRIRPLSQVPAAQRFADVSYRGRAYAVPLSGRDIGREAGRSSQAIALVQQLLNLHRSASDAPTTPLVRVIN